MTSEKYNIVLCGYRDWAIKVNKYIASLKMINCVHFIKIKEQYNLNFKTIIPQKQNFANGSYFLRRKPEDSKLTPSIISDMTMEQLYNYIRALTDPYPNAYFEDRDGNKVLIKQIEYLPKK
jgi:methionyl-tRNA formyltransferase